MLPRKNGSRHKYSALLTVTYTLECGTECNLRLSESYISAEKTLHRGSTHHIVLYFLYTAELIVRFNIAEMILEYAAARYRGRMQSPSLSYGENTAR